MRQRSWDIVIIPDDGQCLYTAIKEGLQRVGLTVGVSDVKKNIMDKYVAFVVGSDKDSNYLSADAFVRHAMSPIIDRDAIRTRGSKGRLVKKRLEALVHVALQRWGTVCMVPFAAQAFEVRMVVWELEGEDLCVCKADSTERGTAVYGAWYTKGVNLLYRRNRKNEHLDLIEAARHRPS